MQPRLPHGELNDWKSEVYVVRTEVGKNGDGYAPRVALVDEESRACPRYCNRRKITYVDGDQKIRLRQHLRPVNIGRAEEQQRQDDPVERLRKRGDVSPAVKAAALQHVADGYDNDERHYEKKSEHINWPLS